MQLVLLLLIPGFLFLRVSRSDATISKDQQWPYLFEIALWSLVIVAFTRLMLLCGYLLEPATTLKFRTGWHAYLPFEYSFTFVASTMCGAILGKAKLLLQSWAMKCEENGNVFRKFFNKVFERDEDLDPYEYSIVELIRPKVQTIIEMQSGKIYVGDLIDATRENIDETKKVIIFAPYLSGFRNDGLLVFNTQYDQNLSQDNPADYLRLMVPFRELISLRKFDQNFFLKCIERKLIKINLPVMDPQNGTSETQ